MTMFVSRTDIRRLRGIVRAAVEAAVETAEKKGFRGKVSVKLVTEAGEIRLIVEV